MKKLSLLIAFVGLFLFSHAQTKRSFDYYSGETLNAIGTSKEQQTQITEIRKNSAGSIQTIKNNTALSEQDKQAKYKEIYTERTDLYYKVLTEEQKQKLRVLTKEFQQNNK